MIDFTPLLSKPKKSILELYPILNEIKEIESFYHKDKDRVLHYMLLAYHPQSPVVEKYTSASKRKEKAAQYAGYKPASREDERIKENLFDHSDPQFLKILNNFLVFINDRLWSMIVANETTFAEYQLKLITPIKRLDEKDKDILTAATIKDKLLEYMDKINQRLDAYYRQLYAGDEKLAGGITKNKSITPESFANHVLQT